MKNFISALLLFFIAVFAYGQSDTIKYDYGRWGIGAEGGPCIGFGFLYKDAGDYINSKCYTNAGVVYSRNNIHYGLRLTGLNGILIKDMEFDDKWKKNHDFYALNIEITTGYKIYETKKINIIPMITGGIKNFNIREGDTKNVIRTKGYGTISASIAIDYKFHLPIREENKYPGSDYTVQYIYIRGIGGIYPDYFKTPFKLEGGLYYLNFSIGAYIRPRAIIKDM